MGASTLENKRQTDRPEAGNVGQQIEVMPHYRRPHPALVWTGHGRAVPRIVMRKGSVVHREVLARVPTVFGGEPDVGAADARGNP